MEIDTTNFIEISPEVKFKLETEPLNISKVSISGIEGQNVILLAPEIRSISNSTTYTNLIDNIRAAKDNIDSLQVFKNVKFVVEKCIDNEVNSANVYMKVNKKNNIVSSFMFETDGSRSTTGSIGGKLPNATGRLDTLALNSRFNSKKMLELNFDWTFPRFFNESYGLSFGLGKDRTNRVEESSFFIESNTLKLGVMTPANHSFIFKLCLRDIILQQQSADSRAPLNIGPSYSILNASRSSFKSSLDYEYKVNNLTSRGFSTRFLTSFAGVGGDVSHMKSESISSFQKFLFPWLKLNSTFRFGLLYPFHNFQSTLADRFFMSDSCLRGFENTIIGPKDKGDSIGGDAYLAGRIQLNADLPLLKDLGIKTNLFLNEGLLDSFANLKHNPLTLFNASDASIGFGFAMAAPFGNAELNFSKQLKIGSKPTLSFGIYSDI